MATLEKIRSKSVLLFVIIIVALLAFILGDFLTSGQTYFGSGTTVASAGSAKVDYHEYQARMNALSEQQQQQGRQAPDNDELAQQVIAQLLFEKMMQQEYDDLGIVVTDKEISEAMTGAVPHPAAQQFIGMLSQQLGLPAPSGAAVFDAMKNPQKYGLPAEAGDQIKQMWAQQEQAIEEVMLQQKFGRLVGKLFTANELDARRLYEDNALTRHISYATQDYTTIPDDEAKLDEADLREAWEQDREMYRLDEPVRSIDYIMVRIEPSQADRLAGQQAVENALLALNSQEGTAAVSADSKFVVSTNSATRSQITDNRLKAFVDTAKVGQAAIISSSADQYTLAKLMAVTNEIDSINLTMMARADRGSLDTVLARLNGGEKYADIVDEQTIQGQDSVWTSLAGTAVPADLKRSLTEATPGQAFIITDTIQGQPVSTLYRVNRRHSAVPYYELALIEYTIDPSQETLSKLSGDLHTFVSSNSSAADFAANAEKAGYMLRSGVVSASAPHVGNMADSRQAVKWVMDAKKGQVMPVFQDNKQTYLLTLAVKGIYDGDYLPYNADIIADQIRAKAINNRKAQILIDKYAGKATDVAGYAKLMGTEPQTGDAMFNSPMLASIGFGESAVAGKVAAAEQGKVTGPVQGNTGVVVFVVTGDDNSGRDFSMEEYTNQFNRSMGVGSYRLQRMETMLPMLLGKETVKNNSLNFVQDFGE
ncbi:MAG: SurA N-terminal domain-containing protein [Bacteroides sp.]|nr:SurA N-terminal domain-containing protein [Bacteroides sp.]MCM1095368.1 SurA N-terminal domain-containing protein [Terasakiella sp.]